MAAEAEQVGAKTLEQLDEQGGVLLDQRFSNCPQQSSCDGLTKVSPR